MTASKTYFDLFAGIGLVDYALDQNSWELTVAVDYDEKKKKIYTHHFQDHAQKYKLINVYDLKPTDLPQTYLGHASFPCTDVSNAGARIGVMDGKQSSAIDSVLGLLYAKHIEDRPRVLLTENVKGLLTSNRGDDIRYLLKHYNNLGYTNDIMLVDAKYFVPQSRPRVFILSFQEGIIPKKMLETSVFPSWIRPKIVIDAIRRNQDLNWSFLRNRPEPGIEPNLSEIIDFDDQEYWEKERSEYLFSQMSEKHKSWVKDHLDSDRYHYATAFRRMRMREGRRQSTAEIRVDGIAGCLRTAKGGSAKQILFRVGKGSYDARLLNEVECARLMGAPDFKISPSISRNDYLFGFGDAVCSQAIKWIDDNYLTPIYEAGLQPTFKSNGNGTIKTKSMIDIKQIDERFKKWCEDHKDGSTGLPIKGRLYGALVVLANLSESDANSDWSFQNTLKVKSTDKGTHFGDRSIKGHTSNKIKLALSRLGRQDLIPTSGGEAGRTSTGTKRGGLEIIQIINDFTSEAKPEQIQTVGLQVVNRLNALVVEQLNQHAELGGIEVAYLQTETIGSYISKLINYNVSKPGAVLQHLVGAKLAIRFKDVDSIGVVHHKSSTADIQTQRYGDFDIGNSVIHVTKSPNTDHFLKAYENAKAGRTTYILIPENKLGMASLTVDIDPNYTKKVNVYSIEQFISQNIDEISQFQKEISLESLNELLTVYNGLIDQYENDSSLKVIIPDFGL